MNLKAFIGSNLCALGFVLASPAFAQDSPPPDNPPGGAQTPAEPPAEPPAAPSPATPETPAPPPSEPPAPLQPGGASDQAPVAAEIGAEAPSADVTPTKIGERVSPLIVTAGVGYAYAAITNPEVVNHSLSGAYLEMQVGTEIDPRFRLSLGFTSFETKIRRTASGKWEEGSYASKAAASGLHSQAGPSGEPASLSGGVVVEQAFHTYSLGPRLDFLPLGSQGPYLGLSTALGLTQDVETRVGADVGGHVGAEWRPFQSLSLGVEAGAHGQLASDVQAAIPYATARINLLLDPGQLSSSKGGTTPGSMLSPRTLPPPGSQ